LLPASSAAPRAADQQRDPELRAVVERAISQAQCFADRYDSAVWYKMMEPKLRKLVPSEAERMDMLKSSTARRTGRVKRGCPPA